MADSAELLDTEGQKLIDSLEESPEFQQLLELLQCVETTSPWIECVSDFVSFYNLYPGIDFSRGHSDSKRLVFEPVNLEDLSQKEQEKIKLFRQGNKDRKELTDGERESVISDRSRDPELVKKAITRQLDQPKLFNGNTRQLASEKLLGNLEDIDQHIPHVDYAAYLASQTANAEVKRAFYFIIGKMVAQSHGDEITQEEAITLGQDLLCRDEVLKHGHGLLVKENNYEAIVKERDKQHTYVSPISLPERVFHTSAEGNQDTWFVDKNGKLSKREKVQDLFYTDFACDIRPSTTTTGQYQEGEFAQTFMEPVANLKTETFAPQTATDVFYWWHTLPPFRQPLVSEIEFNLPTFIRPIVDTWNIPTAPKYKEQKRVGDSASEAIMLIDLYDTCLRKKAYEIGQSQDYLKKFADGYGSITYYIRQILENQTQESMTENASQLELVAKELAKQSNIKGETTEDLLNFMQREHIVFDFTYMQRDFWHGFLKEKTSEFLTKLNQKAPLTEKETEIFFYAVLSYRATDCLSDFGNHNFPECIKSLSDAYNVNIDFYQESSEIIRAIFAQYIDVIDIDDLLKRFKEDPFYTSINHMMFSTKNGRDGKVENFGKIIQILKAQLEENGIWPKFYERWAELHKTHELKDKYEKANKDLSQNLAKDYSVQQLQRVREEIEEYMGRHIDIKRFKTYLEWSQQLNQWEEKVKKVEVIKGKDTITAWENYFNFLFIRSVLIDVNTLNDNSLSSWISKTWKFLGKKYQIPAIESKYSRFVPNLTALGRYRAQEVFNQLFSHALQLGIIADQEIKELAPTLNREQIRLQDQSIAGAQEQRSMAAISLDKFLISMLNDSDIFDQNTALEIKGEKIPMAQIVMEAILSGAIPYDRKNFTQALLENTAPIRNELKRGGFLYPLAELHVKESPYLSEYSIETIYQWLQSVEESLKTYAYMNSNGAIEDFCYTNTGALLLSGIANRTIEKKDFKKASLLPQIEELLMRCAFLYAFKKWNSKATDIAKKNGVYVTQPEVSASNSNIKILGLAPFQLLVEQKEAEGKVKIGLSDIDLDPHIPMTLMGAAGSGKTTLLRSLAAQLMLANMGVEILAKKGETPPIDLVYVSLNDDKSDAKGSRFQNMITRVATILDQIEEMKKQSPDHKIMVCLDELFRGTDDINASALYTEILKYFAEDDQLYLITATHYMLIKDLSDKGIAPQLNIKSFDFDTHQLCEYKNKSEVERVLRHNKYPQSFIDAFHKILDGEPDIEVEKIVEDLSAVSGIKEISDIETLIDLGVLENPYYDIVIKDGFYGLNPPTDENKTKAGFFKWLTLESFTEEDKRRALNFRFEWIDWIENFEVRDHSRDFKYTIDCMRQFFKHQQLSEFVATCHMYNATCQQMDRYQDFPDFKDLFQSIQNLIPPFNTKQITQKTQTEIERRITSEISNYIKSKTRDGVLDIPTILEESTKDIKAYIVASFICTDNKYQESFPQPKDSDIAYMISTAQNFTANVYSLATWIKYCDLDLCKVAQNNDLEVTMTSSYFPGQGVFKNKHDVTSVKRHEKVGVISNDIKIKEGKPSVLVGDNSAGKTVTAKMVAFLSLLGLLTNRSIGKEVSLPKNLSKVYTLFDVTSTTKQSSSMNETEKLLRILVLALKNKDKGVLVVFDELGATISSQEGSALAALVIAILKQEGIMVVTTTHYHQLFKMLREDLKIGEVDSYGFVFDEKDSGSQYKAQAGLEPGKSRGIERSISFIKELQKRGDLKNSDKILSLFEKAVNTRQTIQQTLFAE